MVTVGYQVPLDAPRHDWAFLQFFSEFLDASAKLPIEKMFWFKGDGRFGGNSLCVKFNNVVDVAERRIYSRETLFSSFVDSYSRVRVLAITWACG
jgi:hypothetical protein